MDLILMYISGRLLATSMECASNYDVRLFMNPFFEHSDLVIINTTIAKSLYLCPTEQADAIQTMIRLNHAAKFTVLSKDQVFGILKMPNIKSSDDVIAYVDNLK